MAEHTLGTVGIRRNAALLVQGQTKHAAAERVRKIWQNQTITGCEGEAVFTKEEIGGAVFHLVRLMISSVVILPVAMPRNFLNLLVGLYFDDIKSVVVFLKVDLCFRDNAFFLFIILHYLCTAFFKAAMSVSGKFATTVPLYSCAILSSSLERSASPAA